jgi:hypothetical protein
VIENRGKGFLDVGVTENQPIEKTHGGILRRSAASESLTWYASFRYAASQFCRPFARAGTFDTCAAEEYLNDLHAKGTFTVDVHPLTPAPAEGLSRFSIDKQIHGDLEATSKGEMFSGGDPKQGVAGYVAIEVVTGTLKGKKGSFALQHTATMDQNGPKMSVITVPGSGTGALKGISGLFEIQIANGQHSYDFEYTLPK